MTDCPFCGFDNCGVKWLGCLKTLEVRVQLEAIVTKAIREAEASKP